jgi:FtsX extracellular domain
MRRLRPVGAAAVLACSALLAGCGWSHYFAQHTGPAHQVQIRPPAHFVIVDFCSPTVCAKGATRPEERLVGERLRHEPCVQRVVFTSKAQALAKFRKQHPKLVNSFPPGLGNPLPDSYTVTAAKPSCAASIAAAARAGDWRGVHQVSLARRRR